MNEDRNHDNKQKLKNVVLVIVSVHSTMKKLKFVILYKSYLPLQKVGNKYAN